MDHKILVSYPVNINTCFAIYPHLRISLNKFIKHEDMHSHFVPAFIRLTSQTNRNLEQDDFLSGRSILSQQLFK